MSPVARSSVAALALVLTQMLACGDNPCGTGAPCPLPIVGFAHVQGTLTDSTGAAIAGAEVLVNCTPLNRSSADPVSGPASGYSDRSGRFEMQPVFDSVPGQTVVPWSPGGNHVLSCRLGAILAAQFLQLSPDSMRVTFVPRGITPPVSTVSVSAK